MLVYIVFSLSKRQTARGRDKNIELKKYFWLSKTDISVACKRVDEN